MLYGMACAGTVAWVMYQKFCNALPYFRQEKDWKQYGASITRKTMANWVIQNSEAFFLPMYEYFQRKLLEREFAMADETPLQVLHEPGRRARHSLTCGCSAAGKMVYRRSSSINTQKPEPVKMLWISSAVLKDT